MTDEMSFLSSEKVIAPYLNRTRSKGIFTNANFRDSTTLHTSARQGLNHSENGNIEIIGLNSCEIRYTDMDS